MKSGERTEAAEAISSTIGDWLRAEVETSSTEGDVNSCLDDYETYMEGLRGSPSGDHNITWQKHQGHMNRLDNDVDLFVNSRPDESDFDTIAAKVNFDPLMEISGAYRNYCYACAHDAEDYMERRQRGIGVNLEHSARVRIEDLVPLHADLHSARISPEQLRRRTSQVIKLADKAIESFCAHMAEHTKPQHNTSEAAQAMIAAQGNWTSLTIDAILLTAKLRDGRLDKVPFMLPTSIRNQPQPYQLHYPFAGGIDWAEILAKTEKPYR